eukprot:gene9247-biopygen3401
MGMIAECSGGGKVCWPVERWSIVALTGVLSPGRSLQWRIGVISVRRVCRCRIDLPPFCAKRVGFRGFARKTE